MKGETKKLIKWAEEHFNHYQIEICTKPDKYGLDPKGVEQEDRFIMDFVNFLHTLPEIESKLCHGGYIQDRNGTPCCHGDKVKFIFDDCIDDRRFEMFGQLAWHFKRGQFFILTNSNDYELDSLKWFEKEE